MAIHILVFPFPAQGHMLPLLDLAHRLAALPSIRLTILTTPKNLPSLSPLLSLHSSVQTLILPLPPHPSFPPGVENVRDVGNSGVVPIISSLHRLRDPILQWIRSHPDPPAAILSDFFLGWTSDLGIPRIAFFSSGAFLTCVSNYCWENLETVQLLDEVSFRDLPGAPSFREEHLPSIFRHYKESDPDWELVRESMAANISSSWGCVFNSFDALEGDYIRHLRRITATGRVYSVGPLSLTGLSLTNHNLDRVGVTDWLDGCPDGSVLYVCFGSQKLLTAEQLEAIASGLENSGVRFVWVVKIVEGTGSDILNGFEKRVAGRGKVIKGWVAQVEILNHRAVGYFLSHCGWNSLQEAIVGGVAVLAWPMEADQYVNARLLVEDMAVAVQVCEGANTVPDGDELGRAISEFVREEGSEEKARAKALRERAVAAVAVGGSSACEFDRLVDDLWSLIKKQKHDQKAETDQVNAKVIIANS